MQQEQAINVAEREYNRIIPEARGRADQMISEAEAYAINAINRAKGDAARFKSIAEEYRKAPEVTRSRVFIETMEELLAKVAKLTVVDHNLKGLLPVFGNLSPVKSEGKREEAK